MGTSGFVSPSGDPYIDGLVTGLRWTSALTYSFPTQTSDYGASYSDAGATNNLHALNAGQVAAAHFFIGLINSYIVPQFTFLGNNGLGDVRVANSDNTPWAYAYYPDGADSTGGDIFIGGQENNRTPVMGNYGWQTYSHELGHALGLKHPFEAGHEPAFFNTFMPADRDGSEFTVMTYKSGVGRGNGYTNEDFGFGQTFMQYDILALQYIYGANYESNSGNTTYRWDPNTGQMFVNGVGQPTPGANRIFLTVWDGNGRDLYDFSNYATNLQVDLRAGGWSVLSTAQLVDLGQTDIARGNVFNALQVNGDARSLIEDARGGTGNDTLTGNQAINELFGEVGNDTLFGGDQIDTLFGGDGSDNQSGGTAFDAIDGGFGNDTLFGGVGSDFLNGMQEDDVIFGGEGNESIFGGTGHDVIFGEDGNDVIDGHADNDTLNGGAGNDTLFGGQGIDTLLAGTGNDVMWGFHLADRYVYSSISGGNGSDVIGDFDTTADKVQLVGLSVSTFNGATVLLSDGTTLTAGNGHVWVAGDFIS